MRFVTAITGLVLVGLIVGCSLFDHRPDSNQTTYRDRQASDVQLLNALNQNASKINAIECQKLIVQCKSPQGPITPVGPMACQKPNNFYLRGDVAGSTGVLIGSNADEFWFWMKQSNPAYLYHCNWDSFRAGQVRNMPLPVQPDWLMDVLGMATHDLKNYTVIPTKDNTLQLEQSALSPSGEPIRKVMVIEKTKWLGNTPLVKSHQILDKNGKPICTATILESQFDRSSGTVLPKRIEVVCPTQELTMSLNLEDARVIKEFEPARAKALFSRANFSWQGYDLARGRRDGVEPQLDSGIQPGGFRPPNPPPPAPPGQ